MQKESKNIKKSAKNSHKIFSKSGLIQSLSFLILVSFFYFNSYFIESTMAQTTQTLTGKIVQKPWSKSTQSYCAQGSEYYVLIEKNGRESVLENQTDKNMELFLNKNIKIEGYFYTKTIENKPKKQEDEAEISQKIEQRPINSLDGEEANFTCEVFIMQKILVKTKTKQK